MWKFVEDLIGSRQGQMARSCEQGNAASDPMQCGKRFEEQRNFSIRET